MSSFIAAIGWLFKQVSGSALDKALDAVGKRLDSDVEKEKIKADIIKAYYTNRVAYMNAGGLWLMAIFAVPLALWWSVVIVYSILWCQDCIFAQDWTIAALPPSLSEWAGWIVISIFGVVGVTRLVRK